jgi:hypothetical protein
VSLAWVGSEAGAERLRHPIKLGAKCQKSFEKFLDWPVYYKTFAYVEGRRGYGCAMNEGRRAALDECNRLGKGRCEVYAQSPIAGGVKILWRPRVAVTDGPARRKGYCYEGPDITMALVSARQCRQLGGVILKERKHARPCQRERLGPTECLAFLERNRPKRPRSRTAAKDRTRPGDRDIPSGNGRDDGAIVVRNFPSSGALVIARLRPDQILDLEKQTDDGWNFIKFEKGRHGYIRSSTVPSKVKRRLAKEAVARKVRLAEQEKARRKAAEEERDRKRKLAAAKAAREREETEAKAMAKAAEKARQAELDKAMATRRKQHKHAVAVIIGNRDYAGRTPDVAYAGNDAKAMRDFVINNLGYRPGNVIDLRDASLSELNATFGTANSHKGRLYDYVRAGKSDVIVFYSGHGVPGQSDRKRYLLPVDANPNQAELNGYPLDTLLGNLAKVPARSMAVYLDACFSGESEKGPLVRATSGLTVQPRLPQSSTGMVVVTAAQNDQFASWDEDAKHGLFTKHLLEALRGKADGKEFGNGDGKVTLAELKAYLNEEMTYQARRRWSRDQKASVKGNMSTELSIIR